jgi:hypothetical protein
MKNILIIHPGPFGYHTPTYYYSCLLKEKYNITYLGISENLENKDIAGIKYIHLPYTSNPLIKRISYFKKVIGEIRFNNYDFILVNYFIFCSFIRLFANKNVLVEIRTSYIFNNYIKRLIYNAILISEARLFRNITTISKDLAEFLHLPKRTIIIPLGSPKFPLIKKDFSKMHLLYVGTFYGRNVEVTILGVAKFIAEYKDKINISYSIIGFGSEVEEDRIKNSISEACMSEYISYIGTIRYPALTKFLEVSNIGIAYIPMIKRYDSQPPIKSFEYLLSGMAVLATATKENKKIINDTNGILVGDKPEDIYLGLKEIYSRLKYFNSESIQLNSYHYSWENIVESILIPCIERISIGNKS